MATTGKNDTKTIDSTRLQLSMGESPKIRHKQRVHSDFDMATTPASASRVSLKHPLHMTGLFLLDAAVERHRSYFPHPTIYRGNRSNDSSRPICREQSISLFRTQPFNMDMASPERKTLPEELLQLICEELHRSYLENEDDEADRSLATLKNMSMASQTLRRIAQSLIWHTIHIDERSAGISQILLHVIRHPHLAGIVRDIRVHIAGTDEKSEGIESGLAQSINEPTTSPRQIDHFQLLWDDHFSMLKNAMSKLSISQGCKGWMTAALELDDALSREECQIALFLCFCTNLRSLCYFEDRGFDHSLVTAVFADCIKSPVTVLGSSPFQHLKQVKYGGSLVYELDHLGALFALPRLEKLEIAGLANAQIDLNFSDVRSSLRNICLIKPEINENGLCQMLLMCPNLISLHVDWQSGRRDRSIDYTTLGDVLRAHGSRLQSLTMVVEDTMDFFVVDSIDQTGRLGSLQSLTGMKSLDIPFFRLFNFRTPDQLQPRFRDVLPSNLDSLKLRIDFRRWSTGDYRKLFDCIKDQLSTLNYDERFWTLQSIKFNVFPPEFTFDATMILAQKFLRPAGWHMEIDNSDGPGRPMWISLTTEHRDGY